MKLLLPIALAILATGAAGEVLTPRQAVREVSARAEAGDPEALYQLSTLYERGYDSIPADSSEARRLLERAARGGYLPAQNLLGFTLIKEGKGSEGLRWLEKAGISGDAKAQSNIGYLLVAGEGVERDPEKGSWWLTRAASNGVAQAASMLGDLYADGVGVEQDTQMADSLYMQALLGGITDAAYKLESLRESDDSPTARLQRGLLYYTHGAPWLGVRLFSALEEELGDSGATAGSAESEIYGNALALLGDAYTRAQGVEYDHEKSTYYYRRAAEAGNPAAEFIMAELLEIFPDALPGSDLTADELRRRAASRGVLTAEDATRRLLNPLD